MLRRSMLILTAFVVVSLLSSCDALFGGKNLFSSLDGPDVGALKSATGTDLIDQLEQSKGGQTDSFGTTFVAAVQSDSGAADAIYSNLMAIDASGADYSTKAKAAALAAEFELAVTPAGAVVNNVVSSAIALGDNGSTITADKLIVALVGPVGVKSQADFVALAADLLKVAAAYDALGTSLAAGGSTSLDIGDGQGAVVSLVFKEVMSITNGADDTAKAEAIYSSLIYPSLNGGTADLSIFGATPDTALSNALDNVVGTSPVAEYNAIFNAAGVEALVNMIHG